MMDPFLQQIISQLIQLFGPALVQLLMQALQNAFQNPAHTQQILDAVFKPITDTVEYGRQIMTAILVPPKQ